MAHCCWGLAVSSVGGGGGQSWHRGTRRSGLGLNTEGVVLKGMGGSGWWAGEC